FAIAYLSEDNSHDTFVLHIPEKYKHVAIVTLLSDPHSLRRLHNPFTRRVLLVERPLKNDWHMFCSYITMHLLAHRLFALVSLCGAAHEGHHRLCTPADSRVAAFCPGEAGRTEAPPRHLTPPIDYSAGKDQCRVGTRGRRAQASGARIAAS